MFKLLMETVFVVESIKTAREYAERTNIPSDIFEQLNALDTTPTKKLIHQLLKWYVSDSSIVLDDTLKEIENELTTFIRFSGGKISQPIEKFRTYEEFKTFITPFLDQKTKSEKKDELKGQYEKIFENEYMLVILPRTIQASCIYGANTKWCITQKDEFHFEDYLHRRGMTIYFCLSKIMKFPSNPYHKIAILVSGNHIADAYDTYDDEMDVEERVLPWLEDNNVPIDIFVDNIKMVDSNRTTEMKMRSGNFLIDSEETLNLFNNYLQNRKSKEISGESAINIGFSQIVDGHNSYWYEVGIYEGTMKNFGADGVRIKGDKPSKISFENVKCNTLHLDNILYWSERDFDRIFKTSDIEFNEISTPYIQTTEQLRQTIHNLTHIFKIYPTKFNIHLNVSYYIGNWRTMELFKSFKDMVNKEGKDIWS